MLKEVLTLSSGSALGKLLGVVREVLFAAFFGTSATADAYRAAMTATLAPVHLFTSEALNAAFIPQFRKDSEDKKNSAWSLFNGMGLLLMFISLVVGAVLYFLASTWVSLMLPGFTGERFELTVRMLEVMAWGVPLYVLSALLIYLAIANGNFRLSALRPLVQNLGVIMAIVIAFLGEQPVWIAWGFTGTYLFYSLFGVMWLIRKGILEDGWYRHWSNLQPVAKKFWAAMKPLVFFSVLLQANILLEKAIASLVGPGAVAAVDYARLIPDTAQVLLVVPLGLVSLSAMVMLDDHEVRERSDRMIAMVLLLLVPLSGFVLVSAPDIVRLIYGRGAFDEGSVIQTSLALRGMSIGMWAISVASVLQRIYNARLRNREVLRIGATGIFANALFNIVAFRYMGVLAIGLGSSLGGVVMALLYARGMRGMRTLRDVGRLCVYGLVPYFAVAVLVIDRSRISPLGTLAFQAVWCAAFWGGFFLLAPATREVLQLFAGKLAALKGKV